MGRWSQARRRGGGTGVAQLLAPEITAIGSNLIEATSGNDPEAYPFWWGYRGPTADGPWTLHLAGQPIFLPLPSTLDYEGFTGEWAMVRQGSGIEPLSPESNKVQVDAG